MANRWETMETVTDFIFLGTKITVDGYCSHEIKRYLLLGRKTMTNLDSVLKSREKKSRDITLFKGPYSQSYGFSSSHVWTWELDYINKIERWRIDAFELWCWRRLLRVPWTARRFNQSILKEISPEYPLEGLMLKLQYLGHLMRRAYSLEKTLMLGKTEGRRRRAWQRMRWLDGITNSMDEFAQALGDGKGQRSLVCCSPRGCRVRHDWVTEQQQRGLQDQKQMQVSGSVCNFTFLRELIKEKS